MTNHRIIELKPGESVTIKTADSVKEWLTISEFAKKSNLSRNTVYKRLKNVEIEFVIDEKNGKVKINSNQLKF